MQFCKIITSFLLLFVIKSCNGDVLLSQVNGGEELDLLVSDVKYVIALFCQRGDEEACVRGSKAVQYVADRIQIAEDHRKFVIVHDADRAAVYGFKKLPQIIFYRDAQPIIYPDPLQGSEEMVEWFHINLDISGKVLTDDTFEHDTQAATGATTGDWFVMFYHSDDCAGVLPVWETVASKLKHRMNVARVDTKTSPKLVERFELTDCLTFRMFRLGSMYEYMFKQNRDVTTLMTFAENWYKNVKAKPVPTEPSPFDKVAEEAAKYLKDVIERHGVAVVVGVCVTAAILGVILILACLTVATRKDKEKAS